MSHQMQGAMHPQEEDLASLFAEVLGVKRIGLDDDFFDMGGDSLSATRLIRRLRSQFGIQLSIESFFATPTVNLLAKRLGKTAS